jgi:hypothetical protein
MSGKKYYKHVGGGCGISNKKCPCDDEFVGHGKSIVTTSDAAAHFTMPKRVLGAYQLRRKKGVCKVKIHDTKEWMM